MSKMTPEQIAAMFRREGDPETVIRDFEAEYSSECAECGDTIQPGDKAGYIDEDTVASCWECCQQAKNA